MKLLPTTKRGRRRPSGHQVRDVRTGVAAGGGGGGDGDEQFGVRDAGRVMHGRLLGQWRGWERTRGNLAGYTP